MGFKKPTDIQFKAIPSILKGEDVLAVAQTGTGKTIAFALPIIHLVLEQKKNARRIDGIKALVMVPTHELAQQIVLVFNQLESGTAIKTIGIYGGTSQDWQIDLLEKGADILVTTPGRMFDLIHQGHLRLHRVERLILDEADHMLDLGFVKDIQDIQAKLPLKRQTLFFSATISTKIKKLAYSLIHQQAIRIQISPKDPVSKNIEHSVVQIEMDDKRFFLERLINENSDKKILVFVRTIVRAERVLKAMERVSIQATNIHRDKAQKERDDAMEKFRSGAILVMIATDVSARGIDIPNVDFVVNYDLPEQAENYVHRIGRTGRGREKGMAYSFCDKEESLLLEQIEAYIGKTIKKTSVSKSAYEDTLLFAEEKKYDWKKLIEANEQLKQKKRKSKKRK